MNDICQLMPLPEDILHIFSLIHVTGYHGCRHMVPLFSLSNTMNVMSLYIHNIYPRLCEAGSVVWISNAKMGEKII